MFYRGHPATLIENQSSIYAMLLSGIILLLVRMYCPYHFIDVEDRSWMFFSLLMNNRMQSDVPLKISHVSYK